MVMCEVWTEQELMAERLKAKGKKPDPMLWGLPGYLTQEEAKTFMQFKKEVNRRGGDFKDTVYCFGEEEGEAWALGRWLRARKFQYADVIAMVEQATQRRAEAKAHGFYPDPEEALGAPQSLYMAMYPQCYSGFAKNGVPLFISKAGLLNVDGMECFTTLDGIMKFHWYTMMHDFANRLRDQKRRDPNNFKRFECVIILDLENLTTSQLNSRSLEIIKEQSAVDSLCFPEIMSKMLIINAPTFFSVTWGVIKGWLDPRTAHKIEVISRKSTAEKRLRELISMDQLPSDYGGNGPDTRETMRKNSESSSRMGTKMMSLRGKEHEDIEIRAGETVEVKVFTRSTQGANFTLIEGHGRNAKPLASPVLAKHRGRDDPTTQPSNFFIGSVQGPKKIRVQGESTGGRKAQNYLLVFAHDKKKPQPEAHPEEPASTDTSPTSSASPSPTHETSSAFSAPPMTTTTQFHEPVTVAAAAATKQMRRGSARSRMMSLMQEEEEQKELPRMESAPIKLTSTRPPRNASPMIMPAPRTAQTQASSSNDERAKQQNAVFASQLKALEGKVADLSKTLDHAMNKIQQQQKAYDLLQERVTKTEEINNELLQQMHQGSQSNGRSNGGYRTAGFESEIVWM